MTVPALNPVRGLRAPALLLAILAMAFVAVALSTTPAAPPAAPTESQARAAYGQLPLSFIPNRGQADERVRYSAQAPGLSFFLTDDKAVLALEKGTRGTALEMRFVGASSDARLDPGRRAGGTVNYLTGSTHQTDLPAYGQVAYRDLWPGVDMVFRGSGGKLKYEFHVAPGADPSRIRLAYAGAEGLSLGSSGNLLIATPLGTLRDTKPVSYQRVSGKRVPVDSRYQLHGATSYGFGLGAHDRGRPLVIDPGLEYSTYLGGNNRDEAEDIAVDADGNAYVTGWTASATTFPTTPGAFDQTYNGSIKDAFVTKLNASGSGLVYSTFLGGPAHDWGKAISVDESGSAYVTGVGSQGFPTTEGAADTVYSNFGDTFVTKLSSDGSHLVYSTFLGGPRLDEPGGIAVLANGDVFVAGTTESSFPTTAGAFDREFNTDPCDPGDFYYPSYNGFVSRLNASGSQLLYSTYLGAPATQLKGIAVQEDGSAFVTGYTQGNFPTTPGAYDGTSNYVSCTDPTDAFVTKLNPTGTALSYSTFLGGPADDVGEDIAVDVSGRAFVTGFAGPDFPVTPGAPDSTNGEGEAFVTKVNSNGSGLEYSTYLGGSQGEAGTGIALDASGNAVVAGYTLSPDFPTTPGAFDTSSDSAVDAFVGKVNPSGSALVYSTYLGGTANDGARGVTLDASGTAYVTGQTVSGFPTTAGAFQEAPPPTTAGLPSAVFVTKLSPAPVGYPRPKNATPVQVALVPAYTQCTSPNRTHGPPLAFGSCNPPAQASDEATLGTPDSNAKPAKGSGLARYGALAGDVAIAFEAFDVYDPATLTDYAGELRLRTALRITDRFNSPGDIGTMADTALEATVPCLTTPDPAEGASCNLATTVNALIPGAVPLGKRSVWQLGQVRVDDGGADGDADTAADNTLFMVQGVFVP